MNPRRTPALLLGAVLLAAAAGCGPNPEPTSPSASASASHSSSPAPSTRPSGSPSPSPTTTLTADQQEAFEQATDVVMAYRQTIIDLYSGARTRVNDLDNYVTGDFLETERMAVSQGVSQGNRSEPKGVQLTLVSAEPVKVNLKADPPMVLLWACIDGTAVTGVDADGTEHPGKRERAQYQVVKTTYLPDPGWAVEAVKAAKDPEDRAC